MKQFLQHAPADDPTPIGHAAIKSARSKAVWMPNSPARASISRAAGSRERSSADRSLAIVSPPNDAELSRGRIGPALRAHQHGRRDANTAWVQIEQPPKPLRPSGNFPTPASIFLHI